MHRDAGKTIPGTGGAEGGGLLLFHYFHPILIKLRVIFKTGDMESRDVLLLPENRYTSIRLVTGAAAWL